MSDNHMSDNPWSTLAVRGDLSGVPWGMIAMSLEEERE
jgi:hypothetical protein